MKNFLIFFLLTLFLVSCNSKPANNYSQIENSEADYSIIPQPVKMETRNGRFLVDSETLISAGSDLNREAQYLEALLETASDREILIETNATRDEKVIRLSLSDDIKNPEGYTLEVDHNHIQITAAQPQGIFYAIQSLRQLLPPQAESQAVDELSIPAVYIEDAPQFSYRGMHLDVGRHMFPVEFIKKYIDLIAMHKMNTFHWHLTEDQGWRIEIKKYPKLTEIGSVRKETMIEKNFNPYKGDGKEYSGYYTQDEVRDVVAYAKDKHITIIPEIELPGHSRAALAAYPEFGNDTGPYEVATTWGVFNEIFAPKEETFRFLEDVLTEVMELFPSKYIHIGGDEAPKKEWESSAQAQEVIKREGLKDEHELQSYFIRRIEKFLNENGRQIIGWDEILEGGLAPNATVMSWRGNEGGIAAAKQGHNVVMTPNSHLYFDHYQANSENEPLAIGGLSTVQNVYSFNPIPEELSEEEGKFILGAQANVWTEYMNNSNYVEYMVLPRMSALAEVVWTPQENKDWENFKRRLEHLVLRYEALNFNYARHIFEEEEKEVAEQSNGI